METPLSIMEIQNMTPHRVVSSEQVDIAGNKLYVDGVQTTRPHIILIEFPHTDVGHFVAVWKDKGWNYFDPTGKEMGYYDVLPTFDKVRSNDKVYQKEYLIQSDGTGVKVKEMNTCGRHCVVRLSRDYDRVVTHPRFTPDEIVTLLTSRSRTH